jgi:hypothetical protein
MLTSFRLAWRLNRIELALFSAAVIFVSVALVWLGWLASTMIGANPTCFYHGIPGVTPSDSPSCRALNLLFSEQMTWERTLNLGLAATAAPFVLGTLLGAPIVAKEIEHRTAGMAWTLARSRSAWLVQRLLPVALVLVVALVLIGVAGSWFEDARFNTGFWRGYSPWWLLVARGLLTLGLGVMSGTLIGRVLPAVLLTALTCVVFLPIGIVMDRQLASEAIWVAETDLQQVAVARSIGGRTMYRDNATGDLINMDDYYRENPDGTAIDNAVGLTLSELVVPASRYVEFTLRETAIAAGLALIAGVAAFALVRRRRPY